MFCLMCGKEIADNSRFCPYCGEKVELLPQKKVCPSCGQEMESDMLYCNQCGTKLDAGAGRQPAAQPVTRNNTPARPAASAVAPNTGASLNTVTKPRGTITAPPNTATNLNTVSRPRETVTPTQSAQTVSQRAAYDDVKLAEAPKLAFYTGEVSVGVAKAEGKFSVYKNRIEFKKTMGGSGAYAFGLIGMAVSASKVKDEDALIFWMKDIARVREGSYMGMYPSIILEMKNGEKYTFANAFQAEQTRTCISFIRKYI